MSILNLLLFPALGLLPLANRYKTDWWQRREGRWHLIPVGARGRRGGERCCEGGREGGGEGRMSECFCGGEGREGKREGGREEGFAYLVVVRMFMARKRSSRA